MNGLTFRSLHDSYTYLRSLLRGDDDTILVNTAGTVWATGSDSTVSMDYSLRKNRFVPVVVVVEHDTLASPGTESIMVEEAYASRHPVLSLDVTDPDVTAHDYSLFALNQFVPPGHQSTHDENDWARGIELKSSTLVIDTLPDVAHDSAIQHYGATALVYTNKFLISSSGNSGPALLGSWPIRAEAKDLVDTFDPTVVYFDSVNRWPTISLDIYLSQGPNELAYPSELMGMDLVDTSIVSIYLKSRLTGMT